MNMILKYTDTAVYLKKNEQAYSFFKRIIDIACSIMGLLVLLPLFILIGALIKIDSKGPVFFKQKRCGRYGREFEMYKFRSMQWNAEDILESIKIMNEKTGPIFKIKNDPRITRFGRFIRRTSIDELPQLLNILKGDMSLVGPRPPIPTEIQLYTTYQSQRLYVKPGLTCYWQVMGRNSIGFLEWVELDIKYIRERNLWLDLRLIFKTFKVLLGDENAS